MRHRDALLVCAVLGAVVSLVAMSLMVVWHARGVETFHGVEVSMQAVEVVPNSPVDLTVLMTVRSQSGFPYTIRGVQMRLRTEDELVGIARWSMDPPVNVSLNETSTLKIPLERRTERNLDDFAAFVLNVSPADWEVHAFIEIDLPRNRELTSKEVRLHGVKEP